MQPSPQSPPPAAVTTTSWNLSSTSSRTNYDVFLSFRGPDTRKQFTDCLYHALRGARIDVFIDDKDLCPGEEIDNALNESIKQSKMSIPIISKDYASSRSCLMELAQMVECKKEDNQLIVPIFYDVVPADLKHLRGCVEESFRKHEERGIDHKDIAKWRQALQEIAKMKGYDLLNKYNGYHGELINKVVSDVEQFLKTNDLVITDGLVGIEPHVRKAMEICNKDVHVLKICGMPGVGKTTLAKFVYNKIHHLFEGCSFLEIPKDVESNELMRLQEKLISDLRKQERRTLSTPDQGTKVIAHSFNKMRVLIFIDDVRHFDQIKHLVGNLSWFGLGSRILMTVGRTDILDDYPSEVADKYKVEPMNDHQALLLFQKHAFVEDPLEERSEYDSLSRDIVKIIKGLPLAIVITASYLRSRKGRMAIWLDTFRWLQGNQAETVRQAFKVSYDSLEKGTRQIFLDIACFFSGMDERIASCMWSAWYYPSREIESLCDLCLVEIGENHELWMHSQLREFGREIVMAEGDWPWKRSRIWNHTDALSALSALKRKESAKNVEALALTFDEGQSERFRCEGFGHHWSLRFLRLDQATIGGNFQDALSNLRWLDWQGCSEISELLILHLKNLAILDLSRSSVTGESQVWGQILEKANKLKVLKLSRCCHLCNPPDFRASMYLERLVLEGCSLLPRIGRSVGSLKHLVSLNLKFCKFVKDLPEELCYLKTLKELLIDGTSICMIHFLPDSMEQLEILSACQCESLARISDSIGQLKSLTYLGLDGAAIDRLPNSIKSLKKLQRLLLGNCHKLHELPYSIGNLESLEIMDLSSTMIARLPWSVKNLKKLRVLKMENSHLRKFPKEIKNLDKLEEIDLSQCKNLKGSIRCDMKGLSSLKILRLSSTKTSGLPWSDDKYCHRQTLSSLSLLQRLDLSECDQVRALPILPSDLSNLKLLELLKISDCTVKTLDGLENMLRLRKLTLFRCPSLSKLPDREKYKFEIDMRNY
ncbi:hypothetical protein EUGRSUZ_L01088 [Eucalyptus grandis]|uniref:TIR domain-containing protein n=1 Tax=Eucalyptus grandis TaxID=71139 RepID=A0A058ZUY6_EUCGR|nr:hypothetical protein EUGRSUZ_L01088 [Eucalyptus grandis]